MEEQIIRFLRFFQSEFATVFALQHGSASGFANIGNTCYLNSVLQATFTIDEFSELLYNTVKYFKQETYNSEIFIKRHMPLMEALSNLYIHRSSGNSLTVFLKSILECVRTASHKFWNNRQEDAHEFLTSMLSQLQAEFNKAVTQLNGQCPPFLASSDPVRACFGYKLRRIITCLKCQNETSIVEENTCLIVHINEKRLKSGKKFTFSDLLRDSMAEEILEHVCQNCKAPEAVMKSEFIKLPENFIFVIPRYAYNPNSNRKLKLHAKVTMLKHLTFVTSEDIPNPKNNEPKFTMAAPGKDQPSTSKKIILPPGTDNEWRDQKLDSSEIGYIVEDVEKDKILHQAFEELFWWCKNNFEVKVEVTPCNTFSDEPDGNAIGLFYALSGGNETYYAKLREMIWELLLSNADLFADMCGKSEKVFRDFIKNKSKETKDLPPTNLELHACAALFEAVINVKEKDKWVSYIPIFVKLDDARKVVTSKHFHRKIFFLPTNVKYIASNLHPKRARSYCLRSVVRHIGQNTEGGHYKCAVQTVDGTWSMCNDDVVTNCHEKTVLDKSSDSGYILFYSVCKDRST